MNRFPIWKGNRIGRYDDRLILRSVIFFALIITALSVFMIRLTEGNILLRIFLLFLIAVLCLLDLFYQWKSGNMTDIRNRQAMSRMLLENRWVATEQNRRQNGADHLFSGALLQKEKQTYLCDSQDHHGKIPG